ncbi:acyl-CoA thioesterase [Thiolinea disciformis]|uniref:acyl-CoA thioesterase n=1 Tax=Thiolinea disciformis TaxID=125614 RepID=UPI00035D5925|nr:thioesterase family protein [Thiolinea disciformis]
MRTNIYKMRIAFSDCDPAQIVFFANYFKWFDTASREFFSACGVPSWRETTRERGIIGTPLVDAQASFKNSATYGEDIEVASWIEEWRGKSFTMKHVARRGDTVLCEGREVRVFAMQDPDDPMRIKAVPIPEDIRAACE